MTNLVSIIVPVYNCKPYLEDCIQSVLAQDYGNLELLLIDDGSTDGSGQICDQYAYYNKIRIIHQKNQGVSATRNAGIRLASGDLILFLDSDDTIEPSMVSTMVADIEKEQADCAFCGMIHDYPDHSRNFPETPAYFVTDGTGAIREILINYQATAGPVCKLFRKELLTATDTLFPADLTIGEDALAMVTALLPAKKAVFHTLPFYHYNHREGSLMSSAYSSRDLHLIEAYDRIARLLPSELKKETDFRCIWAHFHVLDKIMTDPSAWDQSLDRPVTSWIRHHFISIIQNPYVGKKRKLALVILLFSRSLYRRIIL